jgi:endo-alpha-N-acetylgalactosaminidase
MPSVRVSRLVAAAAIAAVGGACLTAPPALASEGTATLRSGNLAVDVSTAFPEVLSYTWAATKDVLYGSAGSDPALTVNGKTYIPTVKSTVEDGHVDYRLAVDEIGVVATARIAVDGDRLKLTIPSIEENGDTKVSTIGLPGRSLLSVRADQAGAAVADATVARTYYAPGPQLDEIKSVADLPVDSKAREATIAILSTDKLAGAIQTNAVQSYGNLQLQTTGSGDAKRTGVWSNTWTYRGPDGKVVATPESQVVLTPERNGDGKVDWQDGAIAYRKIMPRPYGSGQTKNNVVSQISLNFASQAQNPFIKTLDAVKKVSLYTDGLGQQIELKGHQDQGHDSAHPDFAGNYNEAAGGLADIKTVVDEARKFNTVVGVHIQNGIEAPRAQAFRWDKTTNPTEPKPHYVYGDTNYEMNQDKDLASGDYEKRMTDLKNEVPNLGFIYSDAFFNTDWSAWKEAEVVKRLKMPIYTEFPTYMWPYVTWYHQSAEYDDIGVNSDILRFVYNDQTDAWIHGSNKMLGGVQNKAGFLGWHSDHSLDKEIAEVFTNNLPAKYLQNFEITHWSDNRIDFTDGVKATLEDGTPRIYRDDRLVRDGKDLFLPWSAKGQQKIYAWSDDGAKRTWTLPKAWNGVHDVTLYKLTDQGKEKAGVLPVTDHKVTLDLAADAPYVVYPNGDVDVPVESGSQADGSNTGVPPTPKDTAKTVGFGHGTIAADGQFYTGGFTKWHRASSSGDVSGINVVTDSNGLQNLRISGAKDGRVTQELHGLEPGHTYKASAYVKVTGDRKATISVRAGTESATKSIDAPTPEMNDADNRLAGQRFQQLSVLFKVPEGEHSAVLALAGAASSDADTVEFTDARVQLNDGATHNADGHYYTEDFEHPSGGSFGPFLIGKFSEPSEIISTRHEGYTRDTISGKHSLETTVNGEGPQFRTWPGSIALKSGHTYRVRLDYQSDTSGLYRFEVKSDGRSKPVLATPLAQTTDRGLGSAPADGPEPDGWTDSLPPQPSAPHASIDETFVSGDDSTYLALTQTSDGLGAATLDNLFVDDLGPAPAAELGKRVATLDVSPTRIPKDATSSVEVKFTNTTGAPISDAALTVDAPDGWSARATDPADLKSVAPGAAATVHYDVTVPKDTASTGNVLAVHAAYTWNGRHTGTSAAADMRIGYDSLPDAYNNVAITDEATAKDGAFDSDGNSFSASALAAADLRPGQPVRHDGTTFTWPDVAPGKPDNVAAQGQNIALTGSGRLAVLGAASAAGRTDNVTVSYTDGTSSNAQLGLPSWHGDKAGRYGGQVVADSLGSNTPSGPTDPTGHYRVFYNTVPLDEDKTVESVTLPNDPALHIFALTTKPLVTGAPTADTYASDMAWTQMTNGWGPAERDHALGEDLAGDGNALTLGSTDTVYDKGLGAAPFDGSPAVIGYDLGGKCTKLTAVIGLDRAQLSRGSVAFEVTADGKSVFTSEVFRPASAPRTINVDLTGAKAVELHTLDGGDGNGNDHGDWANAKFHCA